MSCFPPVVAAPLGVQETKATHSCRWVPREEKSRSPVDMNSSNGLDSDQRLLLRPLLAGLADSCCVLMTSHDWDEVLATAHRVYYLHNGILQEIPIPRVDGPHLWIACDDTAQAQVLPQPTLLDGRFAAFAYDSSEAARRSLWQRLAAYPGICAYYPAYPREAFQEKLNAVAQPVT